jgi:hypothetical protein
MEQQFTITIDGQEVRSDDLNLLGQISGLADDKMFAELFRLPGSGAPSSGIYPIAKWIMPHLGWSVNNGTPFSAGMPVQGNKDIVAVSLVANATIAVLPFRAFVGSRTQYITDAKLNVYDIRSCVHTVTSGQNYEPLTISANASGNARIDLIYALVNIDVDNASTVTRKIKNPSTKVVTTQSIANSKVTTVTIGRVQGTPSATPAVPVLPTDSGNNYYIPLAYVRVPNGFTSGSTVGAADILNIAPVPILSPTTGANVTRVASSNCRPDPLGYASTVSSTRLATWANTGTTSPFWVQSAVSGQETVYIAIDNTGATADLRSHNTNETVDASIDWRNRIVDYIAYATDTNEYAWSQGATGDVFPSATAGNSGGLGVGATGTHTGHVGFGQSFVADNVTLSPALPADSRILVDLNQTSMGTTGLWPSGNRLVLYTTGSDGRLFIWASPAQMACRVIIKLNASSAFTAFAR